MRTFSSGSGSPDAAEGKPESRLGGRIRTDPGLLQGEPRLADAGRSLVAVQHLGQFPGTWHRASVRLSNAGRGWRSKWSATTVSSSMLIFRAQSSHVLVRVVTSTPSIVVISSAKNCPTWPITPLRRGIAMVSGREMWMPGACRAREEARKVPDQEGGRVGGCRELRDKGEGPGMELTFSGVFCMATGSRGSERAGRDA